MKHCGRGLTLLVDSELVQLVTVILRKFRIITHITHSGMAYIMKQLKDKPGWTTGS